jgi:hypothetical protein
LARAFEIMSGVMSTPMTRPGRPTCLRREEAVEPAAAPEVEHGLAGPERGDRLRVAAAEAHVGALGHGGEVFGAAVAEGQARPRGLRGRSSRAEAREHLFARGSGSLLAGSGMGQCSRRALPRKTGHTSSAQSVMTVSTVAGSMV